MPCRILVVLAALVRRSLALLVDLNVSPSAFAVQVPIASIWRLELLLPQPRATAAAVMALRRSSDSSSAAESSKEGIEEEPEPAPKSAEALAEVPVPAFRGSRQPQPQGCQLSPSPHQGATGLQNLGKDRAWSSCQLTRSSRNPKLPNVRFRQGVCSWFRLRGLRYRSHRT